VPLEGDQAERLRSALSSAFGRDMDLQVDVDPTLLGGLVVRVGDELVDGSVVRRLSDLRRRLLR
jgi:F-type H+-transporting ATPase subunit delta